VRVSTTLQSSLTWTDICMYVCTHKHMHVNISICFYLHTYHKVCSRL